MRLLSVLLSLAILSGCSGGGVTQRPVLPDMPGPNAGIRDDQRSLVFAYPAAGQTGVIPSTPIVLRFSHPVDATADQIPSFISLRVVGSPTAVPFTASLVDNGLGVVIQPVAPLKDGTNYQLSGDAIPLKLIKPVSPAADTTPLQLPGKPALTFTTRAAFEGPADLQSLSPTFQVSQLLPTPTGPLIGSQPFGLVDFSSIRLQMTQPVDSRTARYGDTVKLMQGDTLVRARLLVQGSHITIDPAILDPVDPTKEVDLDPTKTYTLMLGSGLRSTLGKALVPGDYAAYSFTPQDSGMASKKASQIAISVPTTGVSKLLGTNVNQVPVASPLLGQGDRAPRPQASGTLLADLALPANFATYSPAVVPLRVPRNSLLTAGNLVVKLDGVVPAGLETGDLTIRLISDADGLLLPNRYSYSLAAPSLVTLEMDISVSAADPTSNGAFTQDILHVQVAGLATIDQANQLLELEAVGVIELKVLGVDNAVGVLALKMQNDLKTPTPKLIPDTQRPSMQSWVPGNVTNGLPGGEFIRPGDPIIVNFTEAMDGLSFQQPGALALTRDGGVPEPFTWRLDGASLIVTPTTPFQHGVGYRLSVGAGVTDLAGNSTGLLNNLDFLFTIPALPPTSAHSRPPVVLANYPGYPCPIAAGTRNVGNGIQGRCAGGQASDDLLPLPLIEPVRAIDVALSQSLLPASVRLGSSCGSAASFRVERIDASGNCLGVVPGRLQVRPRELHFLPDQAWVAGQLYRYVLGSNNDLTSATADCTGNQSICGSNGLPLQTQLIAATLADARNPQRGGPPMEIWFRGGNSLGGSNIGLRVLPVQDVDTNFRLDDSERRASLIGSTTGQICRTGQGSDTPATTGRCIASNGALLQPDRITTGSSYSGAATYFALGCAAGLGAEDENGTAGRDCQGNQFLLISASLGARIGGSVNNAIQVAINPAMVVTSGAQIYADLGLTPGASPGSQALFSALGSIPVLGPLINTAVNTGAGLIDGVLPISARDQTNTELPEGQVYTGPLVFRMRHPAGNGPIMGTIKSINGKLVLETQLDLYTDIPEINASATILGQPAIPIEHNVRSNVDLTSSADPAHGSGSIKVSGEVKFLPDGRLTAQLSNKEVVRLTADLSAVGGLVAGSLKVRVPVGRFIIDASLAPLKQ